MDNIWFGASEQTRSFYRQLFNKRELKEDWRGRPNPRKERENHVLAFLDNTIEFSNHPKIDQKHRVKCIALNHLNTQGWSKKELRINYLKASEYISDPLVLKLCMLRECPKDRKKDQQIEKLKSEEKLEEQKRIKLQRKNKLSFHKVENTIIYILDPRPAKTRTQLFNEAFQNYGPSPSAIPKPSLTQTQFSTQTKQSTPLPKQKQEPSLQTLIMPCRTGRRNADVNKSSSSSEDTNVGKQAGIKNVKKR